MTTEAAQYQLVWSGLFIVTLVGHLRRVAWGRCLATLFSWMSALVAVAILVPQPDDQGASPLEQLFNGMPPLWLAWLFIVGVALAVLAPATVVGLRREWFRDARW